MQFILALTFLTTNNLNVSYSDFLALVNTLVWQILWAYVKMAFCTVALKILFERTPVRNVWTSQGKETEEDFRSTLTNKLEESSCYDTSLSELQESFIRSLRMTYMHIMDAFKKLSASSCFNALSEESLGNITSWKVLVESYITNLGLGPLGSELVKTVSYMVSIAIFHIYKKLPSFFCSLEGGPWCCGKVVPSRLGGHGFGSRK